MQTLALPTVARILVVDDDPILLHALAETISRRLHAVVDSATSASTALERLRGARYDVVLSDVKMPEMNGLRLLQEIEKIAPHVPVVLMTGHAHSIVTREALKVGAIAVLEKPL